MREKLQFYRENLLHSVYRAEKFAHFGQAGLGG
jgi:hypothetical protein